MALPPISPMLAKDSGETIRRLAEIGKAWADTPTLPSMPTLPDQRLFSASPAIERLRATPSVGQQIGAMATIAEAQLEELGALQATINDLQTVTAKGHRQMVWPTRVIAGLTSVLVILTMVLVFLTWVLLSRSAATSPLTTPATTPGVASPSP